MKTLDIDNKFQLAVGGSHIKVTLMHTEDDDYFVIFGSANLRSSRNSEQVSILNDKELFMFNKETFFDVLLKEYSTIKKPISGGLLWQTVQAGKSQRQQKACQNQGQKEEKAEQLEVGQHVTKENRMLNNTTF